jgi:hypothetical protein
LESIERFSDAANRPAIARLGSRIESWIGIIASDLRV